MNRLRNRESALAGIARMDAWDNSNSNVWMLPLAGYLDAASSGNAVATETMFADAWADADRGNLRPLSALSTVYDPAEAALARARLAAAELDHEALEIALGDFERTGDARPFHRAWARSIAANEAFRARGLRPGRSRRQVVAGRTREAECSERKRRSGPTSRAERGARRPARTACDGSCAEYYTDRA